MVHAFDKLVGAMAPPVDHAPLGMNTHMAARPRLFWKPTATSPSPVHEGRTAGTV